MEKPKNLFRINLTIVYLLVLAAVIIFIAFLEKNYDYSNAQNEGAMKFGVSFMTMNNPFFEVITESIRTSVEANGDILIVRDPALDSERQIEQIREMISEGVDAIFVTPVDYEEIVPVIKEAKKAGIIIISVDTELYDESLAECSIVSDNYQAGVLCAQYLMEQKQSANILVVQHSRTKSGNDRVEGFLDTIGENANFYVVDIIDAAGQLELSMPMTAQVLEDGLEFDTVFAINDLSALGAMAALKEDDKLADVAVLGVDGSPEAKAMIKEEIMMATSAQYPSQIGEKSVQQLYKILRGKTYKDKIQVGVELISHDNVDDFGTSSWQ